MKIAFIHSYGYSFISFYYIIFLSIKWNESYKEKYLTLSHLTRPSYYNLMTPYNQNVSLWPIFKLPLKE